MVPITERFLSDAGGWQALKQARALHEMGRVLAASYTPPMLEGRVREGDKELQTGLRILTKSNVENLCTCREAKKYGTICAHALAVGMEILKPRLGSATAPQTAPAALVVKPTAAARGPQFSSDAGEPLKLAIVLPPSFAFAWDKNNVTLGVEASLGEKPVLLTALDAARTYRVTPREIELLEMMRTLNGGELFGMAVLTREPFLRLLSALIDHPRVTFGKKLPIQISSQAIRPKLEITPEANGGLKLRATLPAEAKPLLAPPHGWLLTVTTFQPLAPGLPAAYHALLEQEIVLPAAQADAFVQRELPSLREAFEFAVPEISPAAELPISTSAERLPERETPAFLLRLEGSLNHLAAQLQARYAKATFSVDATSEFATSTSTRRDHRAETAALERLRAAGFAAPDARGELVLKGEPRILAFFARELPRLQREWTVTIGERFEYVTREIERIQPQLEIRSSGENWFDLKIDIASTGGERFSAAEIQRLLQSGQSSARLKNRKLVVFDPAMLDEFQQALVDCDPQQRQPGEYRVTRAHAGYLESVAREQGAAVQSDAAWKNWTQTKLEALPAFALGSLEDTLRPYQKQGVYWLRHLAQSGLAGILADEMGLGKTLQALAFLRAVGGPSLIVCPSSLVFNWQREAARFTPELRVLAVQGNERRELFGEPMRTADLVITSYPLLRRDIEHYRPLEFTAAILDEAQHIKNPESQNAQAACALRARHRFLLTGTPIENSVRDLWSLMNFLMPGYLGSRQDFRDRFEREIQSEPSGPASRRLMKRIQPFLLRRLKQAVIRELPAKIEQVTYCTLTTTQKKTYAELVSATRRQVSELAGAKDQNKARILMLTALLRLRQACCDLRLLGLEEMNAEDASGKLELLKELLQEAVDGGHRVLIFSQFVSMLHLLRTALEESEIPFCYLDGSTKDRAREVDRFQSGDTPAFLISLKAGGVGLNLTAADTVIHFDPWWNPAVEAQATDRAHRIGQQKVVTVYKLITRDTVEEKILALQQRKRAVIEATLESEQPLMEGLSLSELQEMLT